MDEAFAGPDPPLGAVPDGPDGDDPPKGNWPDPPDGAPPKPLPGPVPPPGRKGGVLPVKPLPPAALELPMASPIHPEPAVTRSARSGSAAPGA
jgi:hypothetical protein